MGRKRITEFLIFEDTQNIHVIQEQIKQKINDINFIFEIQNKDLDINDLNFTYEKLNFISKKIELRIDKLLLTAHNSFSLKLLGIAQKNKVKLSIRVNMIRLQNLFAAHKQI